MDRLNPGEHYDAILLDIRIPSTSRIEFYARIIEKEAQKGRIIIIIGDVMGLDIKVFLAQNDLSYLFKPFDINLLKEKIDAIISAGK